jgi:hypothetical protein
MGNLLKNLKGSKKRGPLLKGPKFIRGCKKIKTLDATYYK